MNTFRVTKPGPLTTIQDQGRFGYAHLGLTEGGPMDKRSFALANRLVGNPVDAAALEITLGGLELECLRDTAIAVTGAFCPFSINNQPKALWQSHPVRKGDVISIGFAALGVRAYLSVCGGLREASWFGSQATVIREGLGQALLKEQILDAEPCSLMPRFKLDYRAQPSLRKYAVMQFVPGYQWADITEQEQQKILTGEFFVGKQNDRMGYRLEGEKINTRLPQLTSEGICTGAIQITGDGDPIILMRDRQTIGGYPKIGSVISSSLDTLAQLTQGARIRFEIINAEQSVQQYRQYCHDMEQRPLQTLHY